MGVSRLANVTGFKVKYFIRCGSCKDAKAGCEKHCEKYRVHSLAYSKALEILNDPSLGNPNTHHCKDCLDRHLGCHDTCYKYVLKKIFREIVQEKARIETMNLDIKYAKYSRLPAAIRESRKRWQYG